MRKDLKSMAMAMGKVKNPITPVPGTTQNISNSKRISEKKFERKFNKAKQGEVFETEYPAGQGTISLEGPVSQGSKQTYFKKGKNTFIHRESPDSDYNTESYLKVKNKK